MPRYVVRHTTEQGDVYLVWSSIVDAPVTFGCSLDELRAYWKDEHGREGLERLDRKIAAGDIPPLAGEVAGNRAGAEETELSLDQLVEHYIVRQPDGDPPIGTNDFDREWDRLEDAGACDAAGGAEYQRVLCEWLAADRPEIEPFIRERANVGPDGVSWRPR